MYNILKSEAVKSVIRAFLENNEQIVSVENIPIFLNENLETDNKKINKERHDLIARIYQSVKNEKDSKFTFFKRLEGMLFYRFCEISIVEMKRSSLLIDKFKEGLNIPKDFPEVKLKTLGDYIRCVSDLKNISKIVDKKAS